MGRLFKDLLDVTKLDDKKIKVQLSPIEVSSTVRSIVNGQVPQMSEKGIHYTFGAAGTSRDGAGKTINQEVYSSVDIDFLREAINNLVENAIKYTATGGGIWVNVRGDDDRVLINVTDTGIGISPDDLKHIFQKNIYFDRAYLCQNTYLSQGLTLCQTPFLFSSIFTS